MLFWLIFFLNEILHVQYQSKVWTYLLIQCFYFMYVSLLLVHFSINPQCRQVLNNELEAVPKPLSGTEYILLWLCLHVCRWLWLNHSLLYFPHAQLVLLALLIFVTSIPFPLWVTESIGPFCPACAAAIVCMCMLHPTPNPPPSFSSLLFPEVRQLISAGRIQ